MSTEQIILYLTPAIVYLATELVKWLLPRLQGWLIVSIIVPVLSLLAAYLTSFIIQGDNIWLQAFIGLLAVFVNELIKQLKQIGH